MPPNPILLIKAPTVPYKYKYSIINPQNPILIIKAPTLSSFASGMLCLDTLLY